MRAERHYVGCFLLVVSELSKQDNEDNSFHTYNKLPGECFSMTDNGCIAVIKIKGPAVSKQSKTRQCTMEQKSKEN